MRRHSWLHEEEDSSPIFNPESTRQCRKVTLVFAVLDRSLTAAISGAAWSTVFAIVPVRPVRAMLPRVGLAAFEGAVTAATGEAALTVVEYHWPPGSRGRTGARFAAACGAPAISSAIFAYCQRSGTLRSALVAAALTGVRSALFFR